jgi:hypothetical protein
MSNPADDRRHAKSPGARDRRARTDDLRATTDSIRADAARLATIEQTKAEIDVTDPGVEVLSALAVEVADSIARKTRAERDLSEDLA